MRILVAASIGTLMRVIAPTNTSIQISKDAPNAEAMLGLSRVELTAHGQGASWTEIAHWRRGGWPPACVVCGRSINVDRFGWRVVELDGAAQLKHIRCPAN